MDVLQLDPTNATHVRQFREIRLCALHTDPAAFDSTYERELAFSDAAWRGHLASFAGHPGAVLAVYTAATTGGSAAPGAGPNQVASPVGIVGVNLPEPTDAAIWGMWVAPESRRRGLAAELLHNAEAWAAKSGADTATLWVHRSNIEAQALHHSRGYKLVEPDDLPADVPDACCAEVCMRARLAST